MPSRFVVPSRASPGPARCQRPRRPHLDAWTGTPRIRRQSPAAVAPAATDASRSSARPRSDRGSPRRAPAPGDGDCGGAAAAPPEHNPPTANRLRSRKIARAKAYNRNNARRPSRAVSPSATRPLLRTGEAAAIAACHEATIRRAVRAWHAPGRPARPHGHLRVRADELERWLRPAQPEGRLRLRATLPGPSSRTRERRPAPEREELHHGSGSTRRCGAASRSSSGHGLRFARFGQVTHDDGHRFRLARGEIVDANSQPVDAWYVDEFGHRAVPRGLPGGPR